MREDVLNNDEEALDMGYEDSEDFENINPETSSGGHDEEYEIERDLEELEKREANRHAVEVRRAIEDHTEETRLRKEIDYLFDDEFALEDLVEEDLEEVEVEDRKEEEE